MENVDIFSHEAAAYHAYRIPPPPVLLDIARAALRDPAPRVVVDLGCGTGLSTQLWSEVAGEVIGVEPNEQMRRVAAEFFKEQALTDRVRLTAGYGADTGLGDGAVDLVACSQSLHWMEPENVHPEVSRILRPGGALLAFGYVMPPTIDPAVEAAYNEVMGTAQRIIRERQLWPQLRVWSFVEQLQVMRQGAWYRHIKETFFHQYIDGTADWLVGLACNYGPVARALAKGVSREELGIPLLQRVAAEQLGDANHKFIFAYKALVAVK